MTREATKSEVIESEKRFLKGSMIPSVKGEPFSAKSGVKCVFTPDRDIPVLAQIGHLENGETKEDEFMVSYRIADYIMSLFAIHWCIADYLLIHTLEKPGCKIYFVNDLLWVHFNMDKTKENSEFARPADVEV